MINHKTKIMFLFLGIVIIHGILIGCADTYYKMVKCPIIS